MSAQGFVKSVNNTVFFWRNLGLKLDMRFFKGKESCEFYFSTSRDDKVSTKKDHGKKSRRKLVINKQKEIHYYTS